LSTLLRFEAYPHFFVDTSTPYWVVNPLVMIPDDVLNVLQMFLLDCLTLVSTIFCWSNVVTTGFIHSCGSSYCYISGVLMPTPISVRHMGRCPSLSPVMTTVLCTFCVSSHLLAATIFVPLCPLTCEFVCNTCLDNHHKHSLPTITFFVVPIVSISNNWPGVLVTTGPG